MNNRWQHFPELARKILWPAYWWWNVTTLVLTSIIAIVFNLSEDGKIYEILGIGGIFLIIIGTVWAIWFIVLYICWANAEPTYLNDYFNPGEFALKFPALILTPLIIMILGFMILL